MADNKTPQQQRQADLAAAAEFGIYALDEAEDKKTLRWAIGIAVVLHVLLFIWKFPELASAGENQQQKQKVYVVQQVKFRPPPPKQQQEIPKPKSKKVPVPDPTPDEPEPIRMPEEIEQPDMDLPQTDIIFGIPEGPPSTEPTGPIRVGGDVKAPEKLNAPPPQYTEIARKARIQGVVIVEAIIDKEGNVTNVKVLKGLPMGLDQAAVEAIKKWKFKPATMGDGRPVAVYYTLTVNFQLQ